MMTVYDLPLIISWKTQTCTDHNRLFVTHNYYHDYNCWVNAETETKHLQQQYNDAVCIFRSVIYKRGVVAFTCEIAQKTAVRGVWCQVTGDSPVKICVCVFVTSEAYSIRVVKHRTAHIPALSVYSDSNTTDPLGRFIANVFNMGIKQKCIQWCTRHVISLFYVMMEP